MHFVSRTHKIYLSLIPKICKYVSFDISLSKHILLWFQFRGRGPNRKSGHILITLRIQGNESGNVCLIAAFSMWCAWYSRNSCNRHYDHYVAPL